MVTICTPQIKEMTTVNSGLILISPNIKNPMMNPVSPDVKNPLLSNRDTGVKSKFTKKRNLMERKEFY